MSKHLQNLKHLTPLTVTVLAVSRCDNNMVDILSIFYKYISIYKKTFFTQYSMKGKITSYTAA